MTKFAIDRLAAGIGRACRAAARAGVSKLRDLIGPEDRLNQLDHIEARVFTPRVLGEPLSDLTYLFLGTCQMERLAGVSDPQGCRGEHILYSFDRRATLPPIDLSKYDAAVVAFPLRELLNEAFGARADLYYLHDDWTAEEAGQILARCRDHIQDQIAALYDRLSPLPIFVCTVLEPSFNYLGALQPSLDLDHPIALIRKLNHELASIVSTYPGVYVYDLNLAMNMVGRLHLQDDVVGHFTHAAIIGVGEDVLDRDRLVRVEQTHHIYDVVHATDVLRRYILRELGDAMKVISGEDRVKLIIVDLDDTLWRGVAAETELEQWARVEGWPLGFAEALLYFKRRGGLLAICSKNDEARTKEQFAAIWGDRLSLSDFAAMRINFQSKAENIAAILKEVNLLSDHALFIDDNPREIDEVRVAFPTLRCLGGDPKDWRRIILRSPETQVATISEESRRRTDLVRTRIERYMSAGVQDRAAWLAGLDLRMTFRLIDSIRADRFERALELINKTNQFNTTGRRWTLTEMDAFFASGGVCLAASLKDRTVDNGLTCAVLFRPGEIVQVVLSCRIFGLGAELALGAVATALALDGTDRVCASFIDTSKNLTCRQYFNELGFETTSEGYQTNQAPAAPDWIKIAFEGRLKASRSILSTFTPAG